MSAGGMPGSIERVHGEHEALSARANEDLANALKTSRAQFTGTIASVEVRAKPDNYGKHSPVLCLEIKAAAPVPLTIRAEQQFDDRAAADRAAAALKRGQRITVSSPLVGMRVYLPAIDIIPTDGATPQ